jgi:hypothetical protein
MNDPLPTVSWILPPAVFDEHPAALPAAGATLLQALPVRAAGGACCRCSKARLRERAQDVGTACSWRVP